MTETLEQLLERHKNEHFTWFGLEPRESMEMLVKRHHDESVAWYINSVGLKVAAEQKDPLLDQAALAILEATLLSGLRSSSAEVWDQAQKFVDARPKN